MYKINNINLKKIQNFLDKNDDRVNFVNINFDKDKKEINIVATDTYVLIEDKYKIADRDIANIDFRDINISYNDFDKLCKLKNDYIEISQKDETINGLKIDFNYKNGEYPNYETIFERFEDTITKDYSKKDTHAISLLDINLIYKISNALKSKDINDKYFDFTITTDENSPILARNTNREDRITRILIMPARK